MHAFTFSSLFNPSSLNFPHRNRRSPLFASVNSPLIASTLALLLVVGSVQQLWADCCNDVWSCGAAVATGGLSCVIEGLIDSVKNLQQKVRDLRNSVREKTEDTAKQAEQGVLDAIVALNQESQRAAQDERKTVSLALITAEQEAAPNGPTITRPKGTRSGVQSSQAAQEVSGSGGTQSSNSQKVTGAEIKAGALEMAPGLQPADENELKNEMNLAKQKVEQIDESFKQKRKALQQAAGTAQDQAAKGVQAALDIGNSVDLLPLDGLVSWLDGLLAHPDKIFDPTSFIDSEMDKVTNNLNDTLDQIANAATSDANKTLLSAQADYEEMQKDAAQESMITALMENLHRNRTRGALEELQVLVPAPHVVHLKPLTRPKAEVKATSMVPFSAIIGRMSAGRQKALEVPKLRIQAVSLQVRQLKTIRLQARDIRASLPAYQKSFSQQMDSYFAGKSPAEMSKQRDQLIAEARTRFAKDPRTGDAVIRLLNEEAGRGMAARPR